MCSPPGTSLTFVVPRYTSYRVTWGVPVARFHMTCTLVALPAAAVTPIGAEGSRAPCPASVPPPAQDVRSSSEPQMTAVGTRRTAVSPLDGIGLYLLDIVDALASRGRRPFAGTAPGYVC